MPRPRKTEITAKYKVDQGLLEELEKELDDIIDRLMEDPTDNKLNSERLRIEAKIVALTGQEPIYDNFN